MNFEVKFVETNNFDIGDRNNRDNITNLILLGTVIKNLDHRMFYT